MIRRTLLNSDRATRASRHRCAVAADRFTVDDTELALAVAGEALLGVGNLLRAESERDDAVPQCSHRIRLARLRYEFRRGAYALCERPLSNFSKLQRSDSIV
jgi:hypothetical protein